MRCLKIKQSFEESKRHVKNEAHAAFLAEFQPSLVVMDSR